MMHIASSSCCAPIGAVVVPRWSFQAVYARILDSGRELKLEDFDPQTGEAVYRAPWKVLKPL